MNFNPYSPSRLDTFRRCPRSGYWSYTNQIDRGSSPPSIVGSILHTLAEKIKELLSIDRDIDLDAEIEKHKRLLVDNNAESMIRRYNYCAAKLVEWIKKNDWVLDSSTELKIAVDENGAIVDYNKTKYLRGIIDVMHVDGDERAIVCDYKSGGRVGHSAQKYIYPYLALCLGVKEVEMRFVYLGEEEPDPPHERIVYGSYDKEILRGKIATEIDILEQKPNDISAFLPSPNEWCQYFNCRFICPFRESLIGDDKTGEDLVKLYYYHQTKYKAVYDIIKTVISVDGNISTDRGDFGKLQNKQLRYNLDELIPAVLEHIELADLPLILSGVTVGSTDFKRISKKIKEALAIIPKEKFISKYGFIKE